MKNLTRRRFCSLLLLSIAVPISNQANASPSNNTENLSDDHLSALKECESVYEEWIKNETMSPTQYFFNKMQEYNLTLQRTSEATALDFKNNNFFEINGLKLGKTEAAFLAIIGAGGAA